MKKQNFVVTGMTCSACSSRVEKCVSAIDGTSDVSVNLLTNSMRLSYDENLTSEDDIIQTVIRAGYGAYVKGADTLAAASGSTAQNPQEEQIRNLKFRFIASLCLLIPLMYISMNHMIYEGLGIPAPDFIRKYIHGNENAITFAFSQFLLLIPIVFLNRAYFEVGFRMLAHRSPNMDSLIAVGATASIAYGIFVIFRLSYGLGHGDDALVSRYSMDVYFESAGTILTLITLGKFLEAKSKGKTSEAIEKLIQLAPSTAIVERDGTETEIPISEIREGDIFIMKPGASIPADGIVVEGSSGVDESAITGESIPVEKTAGDRLIAATINRSGFLKGKATRVGENTTLNQIIHLVEEASSSKAPIAKMADKIAGVFVPAVMTIALAAFIIWIAVGATFEFALSVGIAVLVISCPCALGLATPVAIMVGTGKGAENGILIKSGEALEIAHNIDTVVMDKTGTITEGKPVVTDIIPLNGADRASLLSIAYSLEKSSEHPLAEAICTFGESENADLLPLDSFESVGGRGIRARLRRSDVSDETADAESNSDTALSESDTSAGHPSSVSFDSSTSDTNGTVISGSEYLAGNWAFLEENGISAASVKQQIDLLADQGKTPLLFADGKQLIGIIAVADVEKESSRQAIERFQNMNIDVIMLTGDNERTAKAIQQRMGIGRVIAQVLPEEKEKIIAEIQASGHTVAMIGDGINDAPALARADVGIAIGAGTDVAIESADIVLMKSDLLDAVTAVQLSKAVIRNIRQNLFWAFFYNIIGIPLAAGVLYPAFGLKLNPMFCAAAMSMSSVCVVTNALRLKFFRPDKTKSVSSQSDKTDSVPAGQALSLSAATHGRDNIDSTSNNNPNNNSTIKDDKEEEEMLGRKKYDVIMEIEGMMCHNCERHVREALNAIGAEADVDHTKNRASLKLTKEISDQALTKAVEDSGYKVLSIQR